jgi:hypothetical protein
VVLGAETLRSSAQRGVGSKSRDVHFMKFFRELTVLVESGSYSARKTTNFQPQRCGDVLVLIVPFQNGEPNGGGGFW